MRAEIVTDDRERELVQVTLRPREFKHLRRYLVGRDTERPYPSPNIGELKASKRALWTLHYLILHLVEEDLAALEKQLGYSEWQRLLNIELEESSRVGVMGVRFNIDGSYRLNFGLFVIERYNFTKMELIPS